MKIEIIGSPEVLMNNKYSTKLENDLEILLVILAVYAIGTLIYKHYSPKIKGARGESNVARRLRKLSPKEYKIFNDIYLQANGKTTQIDHLIISVYGIFVIETKNYSGWIYGSEKSAYWTQTFYHKKQRFRNPIKQNWAHIFFLKEILLSYHQVKYHSIIVFAGKAELKNIYSNVPVIYVSKLLKTIRQNKTLHLSVNQVDRIVNQLNKYIVSDYVGKKQHKKYIKSHIIERRKNIRKRICPNCKGELIIRKGKYGKFYGCSNYPRCKFTAKV